MRLCGRELLGRVAFVADGLFVLRAGGVDGRGEEGGEGGLVWRWNDRIVVVAVAVAGRCEEWKQRTGIVAIGARQRARSLGSRYKEYNMIVS